MEGVLNDLFSRHDMYHNENGDKKNKIVCH